MTSCGPAKDIIYIEDLQPEAEITLQPDGELRLQPGEPSSTPGNMWQCMSVAKGSCMGSFLENMLKSDMYIYYVLLITFERGF